MKKIILHQDQIVGPWVSAMTGGAYSEGTTIGLVEHGQLIAGVLYDGYNGASIQMHVGAIGKRWMTKEYLWMCFHYPFEQLKVKKIIGLVGSGNEKAIAFDEHLGFQLEHSIEDAHRDGALLVYTMTREQCRFLRIKNGCKKLANSIS